MFFFVVTVNHRLKRTKKKPWKDEYLNLAGELKKLRYMVMIPDVVDAQGTVLKDLKRKKTRIISNQIVGWLIYTIKTLFVYLIKKMRDGNYTIILFWQILEASPHKAATTETHIPSHRQHSLAIHPYHQFVPSGSSTPCPVSAPF